MFKFIVIRAEPIFTFGLHRSSSFLRAIWFFELGLGLPQVCFGFLAIFFHTVAPWLAEVLALSGVSFGFQTGTGIGGSWEAGQGTNFPTTGHLLCEETGQQLEKFGGSLRRINRPGRRGGKSGDVYI